MQGLFMRDSVLLSICSRHPYLAPHLVGAFIIMHLVTRQGSTHHSFRTCQPG